MLTTKQHPYELLIRWGNAGALAGAHVQRRYVIADENGVVIGESVANAEPLTINTAAGFPLGDLLSQAQIDALVAKAAADQERDAAAAARDAALQAQQVAEQGLVGAQSDLAASRERVATLQAERDAALARVAQLEAQVAAPRPSFE